MRRPPAYLVTAALAALAGPARAGDPGLGDGHWGALQLRPPRVSLSRAAALSATGSGAALQVTSPSGFAAGDLVMLYQAQDALVVDSGTPGPFDLPLSGA